MLPVSSNGGRPQRIVNIEVANTQRLPQVSVTSYLPNSLPSMANERAIANSLAGAVSLPQDNILYKFLQAVSIKNNTNSPPLRVVVSDRELNESINKIFKYVDNKFIGVMDKWKIAQLAHVSSSVQEEIKQVFSCPLADISGCLGVIKKLQKLLLPPKQKRELDALEEIISSELKALNDAKTEIFTLFKGFFGEQASLLLDIILIQRVGLVNIIEAFLQLQAVAMNQHEGLSYVFEPKECTYLLFDLLKEFINYYKVKSLFNEDVQNAFNKDIEIIIKEIKFIPFYLHTFFSPKGYGNLKLWFTNAQVSSYIIKTYYESARNSKFMKPFHRLHILHLFSRDERYLGQISEAICNDRELSFAKRQVNAEVRVNRANCKIELKMILDEEINKLTSEIKHSGTEEEKIILNDEESSILGEFLVSISPVTPRSNVPSDLSREMSCVEISSTSERFKEHEDDLESINKFTSQVFHYVDIQEEQSFKRMSADILEATSVFKKLLNQFLRDYFIGELANTLDGKIIQKIGLLTLHAAFLEIRYEAIRSYAGDRQGCEFSRQECLDLLKTLIMCFVKTHRESKQENLEINQIFKEDLARIIYNIGLVAKCLTTVFSQENYSYPQLIYVKGYVCKDIIKKYYEHYQERATYKVDIFQALNLLLRDDEYLLDVSRFICERDPNYVDCRDERERECKLLEQKVKLEQLFGVYMSRLAALANTRGPLSNTGSALASVPEAKSVWQFFPSLTVAPKPAANPSFMAMPSLATTSVTTSASSSSSSSSSSASSSTSSSFSASSLGTSLPMPSVLAVSSTAAFGDPVKLVADIHKILKYADQELSRTIDVFLATDTRIEQEFQGITLLGEETLGASPEWCKILKFSKFAKALWKKSLLLPFLKDVEQQELARLYQEVEQAENSRKEFKEFLQQELAEEPSENKGVLRKIGLDKLVEAFICLRTTALERDKPANRYEFSHKVCLELVKSWLDFFKQRGKNYLLVNALQDFNADLQKIIEDLKGMPQALCKIVGQAIYPYPHISFVPWKICYLTLFLHYYQRSLYDTWTFNEILESLLADPLYLTEASLSLCHLKKRESLEERVKSQEELMGAIRNFLKITLPKSKQVFGSK